MLLRRRTRRWTLHIWIYLFTVRCTFKANSHIRDFRLAIHNDVEIAAIGCMQPIPAR